MSQVPAFDPASAALTTTRAANRFNEMSSEDFIRIIFTELSNQDPFEPNDSGALLEQLNSIRSIESDLQMVDQLQSLVLENQLGSAAGLIGQQITGLTTDLVRASGIVMSVIREGDQVSLELDSGHRVPLNSVEAIVSNAPA